VKRTDDQENIQYTDNSSRHLGYQLILVLSIKIKLACTLLLIFKILQRLWKKVCQWLATGRWFSPVSSINKTDHHDITEILLKVALNTTTPKPYEKQEGRRWHNILTKWYNFC